MTTSETQHRTHRTHADPDVTFRSRFGELGIWLSYRDEFFVKGIGAARYRWGNGTLRVGTSVVNLYAEVVPDPAGGYRLSGLRGDRYFASPSAGRVWGAEYRSDRMTRKQLAYVAPILTAEVNAALAGVAPETIEACHRRGVEADIRALNDSLAYHLRAVSEAVAKAQEPYDRVRALERELGLPPTPPPPHLAPADDDLDALMGEIEALGGAPASALAGGKVGQ